MTIEEVIQEIVKDRGLGTYHIFEQPPGWSTHEPGFEKTLKRHWIVESREAKLVPGNGSWPAEVYPAFNIALSDDGTSLDFGCLVGHSAGSGGRVPIIDGKIDWENYVNQWVS